MICFDFAVIELCRKYKIPFIVSTQNSVSNKKAALFYKSLGAKRIVLARELKVKQIKEIGKIKNLEIEVFAHGAMCVAISGRCFLSQFLFNRSANRGECMHPCRRKYKITDSEKGYELELGEKTVMSAKDLCTIPFIKDLKRAGVSSFKIEGRNRDERYISTVVKAYRRAIDEDLSADEAGNLIKEMEKVFNRGFSSGFYLGRPVYSDFAQVENSASSFYRDYIGKTTHFYPKAGVILLRLSKKLKVGDKIIFIGKNIGIKEVVVKEMEINNERFKEAGKGSEVGIRVDFKGKRGLDVYKVVQR